MTPWKTLSKKIVLEGNQYLKVEHHTIELPDGRVISEWPWVIMPDFVNVVALTEDNKFLCFRQTKYAIEGTSLAPIGGYVDPGEEPFAAAQRELLEETGYKSDRWSELGSYAVDANRGCGTGHFFLARIARKVTAPNKDDLEEQELLFLARQEVDDAISRGDFRILSWMMAICLAVRSLDNKPVRMEDKHNS